MLSCPHTRFGRKLASQLLLYNPEEGRASPHLIRIEELVGKSCFLWKSLSEGCVPEASTLPCTQRIPPGSPSQPGIQCFCKPEEPPFESLREFISSFIPIVPGPQGGQGVPEETTTQWRSLVLLAVETTPFPQVPWPLHFDPGCPSLFKISPGLPFVG